MKILALIIILMLSINTVFAGPAIDRAKVAMEAFKGAPISNEVALIVVTEWATSVEPRMKSVTICNLIDEEEICFTSQVPDPWNVEELAGLYLDRHYGFDLRQYNAYRMRFKRANLQAQQDVLNAQVEAERVTDL